MKITIKNIYRSYIYALFPNKKNITKINIHNEEDLQMFIIPKIKNNHITLTTFRNETIKNFLYAIKYKKYIDGSKIIGKIIKNVIYEEHFENSNFEKMKYMMCAIPITYTRKCSEQYDHLKTIIDYMYDDFNILSSIVYKKDALCWNRDIERQSSIKNRKERIENVKNAIKVNIKIPKNTICFVIDDITTTGATLNEARRALLEKGAEKVITIAFARA